MQPFTLEERLMQSRMAEVRLGATIPWLVDAMDNRLKHALGDRANSEFVIDPNGVIVRKRPWSHPEDLRRDLEELVGPVPQITRAEDIVLPFSPPPAQVAAQGVKPRIQRRKMQALQMEPVLQDEAVLFFAKLRAEGDAMLISKGVGKLYLGFHLDPLHAAHWNNLTAPLTVTFETAESIQLPERRLTAPAVAVAADCDPREFMVDVASWPVDEPLRVNVQYFACVGETACYAVTQSYVLRRLPDGDGGGARGEGAGYWESEDFRKKVMAMDKDGDQRLSLDEVSSIVAPQFAKLDQDHDGYLTEAELEVMTIWLNHYHQPSPPVSPPPIPSKP